VSLDTDILIEERAANEQAQIDHRDAVKQLQEDYKQVFLATRAGRRVLADMLAYSQVMSTTYTGNSKTFFNEGARATGLRILDILGLGGPEGLAKRLATGAGYDD